MKLIDIFLPKWCVLCGKSDSYLCDKCLIGLSKAKGKMASIEGVSKVYSVYSYEDEKVEKLIKAVKYRLVKDLIKLMIKKEAVDEMKLCVDFIIPIPLHRRRENYRGFNQSEVLAMVLKEYLEIPVVLALERVRFTKPVAEMKHEDERKREVGGAFRLVKGAKKLLLGKKILLVDDVLTYGATVGECVKILKKVKGIRVEVFVLAS